MGLEIEQSFTDARQRADLYILVYGAIANSVRQLSLCDDRDLI
ncbi:hypothetical protein [Microcoleus sp. herbarium5]